MKIVKKYYDQFKKEMDEARRRCQEAEQGKTSGEIADEKIKLEKEIETFINEVRESEQNTFFKPDEERKADFDIMCELAMLTARYLELNIEIDTDNKNYSTIEFTMEQLYLMEGVSKEICFMFGMMFLWADEVWVDQKDNLISFLFFFRVNDKIVGRKV